MTREYTLLLPCCSFDVYIVDTVEDSESSLRVRDCYVLFDVRADVILQVL